MKKLILGLILGLFLGTISTSFAAVGDKIEAIYSTFNFKVNGIDKNFDALPIVIEGKSYLPVTEIANTLGYDVTYKEDSRTIEFTNAAKEGGDKMAGSEKLSDVQKNLDVMNQTIEWQKKERIRLQNSINQGIEYLKSNGMSQAEIDKYMDKDIGVRVQKQVLKKLEEQMPEFEQYKLDLQNQINALQIQTPTP